MKPPLCDTCPLREAGDGYAFGEGPKDAQVCLLGEALGAEEVRQSRPFVGGAGRILNALLQKANIKRYSLYVTNVVRCRPPENRTPTDNEITECMARHDTLSFLRSFNLTVLLGGTSLKAITGRAGITVWRGSVFQQGGQKFLATFHPAAIMRQQEMFPISVADLSKIHQEGWTNEYTPPTQNYVFSANEGHLAGYGKEAFAFDVETTSLEAQPGSITVLGLSQNIGEAHVFRGVEALRTPLQDIFLSPVTKIGHNILFDVRHLEANGIPVEGPLFDTLVAHHLVLSDVPNDLAFVASLYTRLPYWKHLMKENLELYNALDVDATYQIYDTLEPQIRVKGLQRVFDTSMKALPILQKMSERGIAVDNRLQTRWRVGLERVIQRKEKELLAKVGDVTFNWRSPKQLATLLYSKLKLPKYFSKHRGVVTTDEDALEGLLALTNNPILERVMELRKLSKLASTYFSHPEAADGRIHSEYLLHGTGTGRLASRGPNLQNVPKGPARAIYKPSLGHVFVSADYNQIELRIAAVLSEEQLLLEAFTKGEDIHRAVAAEVYHIRLSEVTELQRFRAKFIVYGLLYGRGARSIAKEHKMPLHEAHRFISEFFYRFSNIKGWLQTLVTASQKDGYLVNPFGRRRYFFGQEQTTKVYNFPPQSTAADIMLEAMVRLDGEFPKGANLLLQVHDQLVVECLHEQKDAVIKCLHEVMEAPIDVLGNYKVPIKVKTGHNWQECD